MFNFISKIFTGSGVIGSIERIASEAIETQKETAEAKSLFIKTLDPNGLMRRDISNRVGKLYTIYIVLAVVLLLARSFGVGDIKGVEHAIDSIVELFVPITTMFTAIVGASFGVNGINASKKQ
jgi:hypothetical protein